MKDAEKKNKWVRILKEPKDYQKQKETYTIINHIISALIKSWQSNTREQR